MKKKVNRKNIIYYCSQEPFDFKTFKTVWPLVENIFSGKFTMNESDLRTRTNQEQADLKNRDQKIGIKKYVYIKKCP